MRKSILCAAAIALTVAVFVPGTCIAAEKSKSPADLRRSATEIFTGKIARLYSYVSKEGNYEDTHYVAEIKVERVEKGEYDAPLAYARFDRSRYIGRGNPSPDESSERITPKFSGMTRVYVKKADDGGFDALSQGFESLAKPAK
jgi:hypothetical protein